MNRWFRLLTILSVFVIMLAACGQEATIDEKSTTDEKKAADQLNVYTTIYPLSFFTEEIGKEYVKVTSVLPAGVDAHTYEPTAKTMIDIADADLFFYNGLGLEPFGEKVKNSMQNENVKIVEVGKTLDLEAHQLEHGHEEQGHEEHEHEGHDGHNHGSTDPHVWIDPTLAMQMAEVIKNELVEKQPEHQEEFEKNYKALTTKLQKLDEQFHQMADQAKNKEFLVSHAAFGYWEQNYGLKQISVAGLSPTNEPSQKQLKEMIEVAKSHGIKYVIFEQNITPKVAKIVQEELKAEALHIHNLSVLTEDDEKNKDNYLTLMEKNIEVLKKAMN